jgi:uncharacterized protein YraI
MTKQFKRILIGILVMMLISSGVTSIFAQTSSDGMVRFVHAIPGASAVDVYTDGQLTISNLAFGSASTYVHVSAGDHQLTVTQTGATAPLWQQSISTPAGSAQTLVAASASQAAFQAYTDDLTPVALGKARLTAIHAIAGGPDVDLILSDGRPVIPGLKAGVPAGTLDVPAFNYEFAVVPAGGSADAALVSAIAVPLTSGADYTLVVYGTADSPATLLLSAPTTAEARSGWVRIAHGVPGAPAVDIYLNGTLAVPSLAEGQMTEHVALPAGSYAVGVRAAGGDTDLLSATVDVQANQAVTIAALGTPDNISAQVLTDNIAGIDASKARLSLVNGLGSDATLTATLADGTTLGNNLPFATTTTGVDIAPSSQALSLTTADGSSVDVPAQAFYGGVYYDLLAVNDNGTPKLLVGATSLAQGIASAPGAGTTVLAAPPAVEATLAPTEAPVVAVEATLPPAPQPTAAPSAPAGPTGRVFNLNPDANLQLRQYPNTAALSLGTVPPATVLTVNGREGAIEPIPSSATPTAPEGYEFVDPASLLTDPKDDLAPEQTWLNVTFTTPDGGSITAWVNALYVDVRDPRGDRMRLADLPMVAGNTPGEALNTAVTPPPVPVDRVAVTIIGLDANVNLNIRRTPETTGEVLVRIPNGTVMEFEGITQDQKWVFVSYNPPEGGNVTGWIDAQYADYSFNSKRIKLDEMDQRKLLVITPPETRGEVTAGVPQAALPTVNPVKNAIIAEVALDAGANLNLRRKPDANSEVLIPLPSGTQVIVTGRSADERWLNVTFEDQSGWIAAKTDTAVFVRLSLNGKPIQFADVPLATDVTPESTAPVVPNTAGATITPTEGIPIERVAAVVTDTFVILTGSPGGASQGLPGLSKGQEVTRLFTDGQFSYIELPDGTKGWVPAGSIQAK